VSSLSARDTPEYMDMSDSASLELESGKRFGFGDNWREFLRIVDEGRIAGAIDSLKTMLGMSDLEGKRFLDAGSGSGLFSLAARRLGATVHSFDYDLASVCCTAELRRRYFCEDKLWTVESGSVLNAGFLKRLGDFDIVYSWGVLHHTGEMWRALDLVAQLVKPGGKLFISIYNDQGRSSRQWRVVKRTYCRLPKSLKPLVLFPACMAMWGPRCVLDALKLKPFQTWRNYRGRRGMSPWRDAVDWVGGYPFEVAKPEQIFEFYQQRAFTLKRLKTTCSYGTNEFVFERLSCNHGANNPA
jgi:SAM-dependent methyltransferase